MSYRLIAAGSTSGLTVDEQPTRPPPTLRFGWTHRRAMGFQPRHEEQRNAFASKYDLRFLKDHTCIQCQYGPVVFFSDSRERRSGNS
jgi:hypothetical protein